MQYPLIDSSHAVQRGGELFLTAIGRQTHGGFIAEAYGNPASPRLAAGVERSQHRIFPAQIGARSEQEQRIRAFELIAGGLEEQ